MQTRIKESHNGYTIKSLLNSEDEIAEIEKVFQDQDESSQVKSNYLRWLYTKNPAGNAIGFNAYLNNKLASHYAAIPVQYIIDGEKVTGLLSLNTITAKEHQGKGLFTTLAEITFSRAREMGFDFVIGVANGNSVYGFVKKLSFQHVGQLETRFIMQPRMQDNNENYQCYRDWNEETLKWRLENPNKLYRVYKNGNFNLVESQSKRFKVAAGFIHKNSANLHNQESSCSLVPRLWIGIDTGIDWVKTWNFVLPEKFKKVPLNLIFKDLSRNRTIDKQNLKFWAMDFDSY